MEFFVKKSAKCGLAIRKHKRVVNKEPQQFMWFLLANHPFIVDKKFQFVICLQFPFLADFDYGSRNVLIEDLSTGYSV